MHDFRIHATTTDDAVALATEANTVPVDERAAAMARALIDGRLTEAELQEWMRLTAVVAQAILYGHSVRPPVPDVLS
ncbi:MAG: hypothetical protein KJ011_06540 [Burkholderiaceae bacterium]|nr:hypothetical protein [Burkholderiaceae bacterium]